MSATLAPPKSSAQAPRPALPRLRDRERPIAIGDRTVIAILAALFVVMVALTWRKWGMPEGDAGAEMTTADLIKHHALAYRDVRYFYGPLGLYSLALAFKVFGTSLTTAFGFGLLQAAAILGVFYVLARQWLGAIVAGLSTAMLLAIGFSGTSFNFILPHTNSATFGILTVLLMLLALRRGHVLWAGVAAGLVALTRPEFLAVAGGAAAAYLLATWRMDGRRAALSALWRLSLPGVAIPVAVLGFFASSAGLSNLLWQNLWPTDFLRHAGFRMQAGWMPFDVASAFGLVGRATVYLGLLAALVLSVEGASRQRGLRRVLAVWPLVAAVAGFALADGAMRAIGLFGGERAAIETELRRLILGMSWLPALGLGTSVWAVLRLVRRGTPPLGGSWGADFALIVAAAALGLRAYDKFTAYGSYAPYYAAPLVLMLGILHARVAARRPQARVAVFGALGLAAAGLAAYSVFGLYRQQTATVHTPRGTFVTFASAAPALQAAVHTIDADSRPTDRILVAPVDAGMYFFSDRRPAIYELTLLPGLLATPSAEAQAIASLRRYHAALAVLGARDNSLWRTGAFGVGYDKLVGDYLRRSATTTITIGPIAHPAAGTYPSHGFTILRLRG
jgi:hypothetical protein